MQENSGFKKELGLFDSTMLVVGSMIGSGIFIVSADIARTVGSSGYLILVWVVTGIITLIGALSYGELAGMMPKAGGQYVYLREAYNPLIAFLYGWTFFMVIQTGIIAAVAVAFAKFLSVIIPSFSESNILFSFSDFKVSAAQIIAILSIFLLTLINMRGIKTGKLIQDIFSLTKILAIGLLILLGLFIGANYEIISANFTGTWDASWTHIKENGILITESLTGFALIAAIGSAMVGSLFSSDSWNNITFTAGEVQKPERNIPLSLFYGTLTVTIIYILTNISYLFVLPLKGTPDGSSVLENGIQFASGDRVGTAAAYMIFGESALYIMAFFIVISTFGCNNGMIIAGARVFYTMANDNLFFKTAGVLNKYKVPGNALLFQAIWASILCLSGTYGQLLDYVIFAVLIFYILTISGLFILRKKKPEAPRPYKAFGYPVLPALYIILASSICVILLIYKPLYTWPGLIIVLLGIPIFYMRNLVKLKS